MMMVERTTVLLKAKQVDVVPDGTISEDSDDTIKFYIIEGSSRSSSCKTRRNAPPIRLSLRARERSVTCTTRSMVPVDVPRGRSTCVLRSRVRETHVEGDAHSTSSRGGVAGELRFTKRFHGDLWAEVVANVYATVERTLLNDVARATGISNKFIRILNISVEEGSLVAEVGISYTANASLHDIETALDAYPYRGMQTVLALHEDAKMRQDDASLSLPQQDMHSNNTNGGADVADANNHAHGNSRGIEHVRANAKCHKHHQEHPELYETQRGYVNYEHREACSISYESDGFSDMKGSHTTKDPIPGPPSKTNLLMPRQGMSKSTSPSRARMEDDSRAPMSSRARVGDDSLAPMSARARMEDDSVWGTSPSRVRMGGDSLWGTSPSRARMEDDSVWGTSPSRARMGGDSLWGTSPSRDRIGGDSLTETEALWPHVSLCHESTPGRPFYFGTASRMHVARFNERQQRLQRVKPRTWRGLALPERAYWVREEDIQVLQKQRWARYHRGFVIVGAEGLNLRPVPPQHVERLGFLRIGEVRRIDGGVTEHDGILHTPVYVHGVLHRSLSHSEMSSCLASGYSVLRVETTQPNNGEEPEVYCVFEKPEDALYEKLGQIKFEREEEGEVEIEQPVEIEPKGEDFNEEEKVNEEDQREKEEEQGENEVEEREKEEESSCDEPFDEHYDLEGEKILCAAED